MLPPYAMVLCILSYHGCIGNGGSKPPPYTYSVKIECSIKRCNGKDTSIPVHRNKTSSKSVILSRAAAKALNMARTKSSFASFRITGGAFEFSSKVYASQRVKVLIRIKTSPPTNNPYHLQGLPGRLPGFFSDCMTSFAAVPVNMPVITPTTSNTER